MRIYAAGPVPMDPETLEISGRQLPYFRTKEFSEIMLECNDIIRDLLGTSKTTKTMFIASCGTAAMEAAVINIFTNVDKLLVISGGTFGKRFSQICDVYGIENTSVHVPYGKTLTRDMVYRYDGAGFTGLLVNIHETSFGQLYDIEMLSEFCQKNKMVFVVDAISSFLVDKYEMDRYSIDATIISSQKGLGLAPGLSALLVNEKTYEARVKNNGLKAVYLNFNNYYPEIERGQTPYTPPIGVILQLHEKLTRVKSMRLDEIIARNREIAVYLRKRLVEIGLSYPETNLSNGVTPVLCPKNNAKWITRQLIERYDVYVNPCSGEVADSAFRIGHMGLSVNKQDIDFLIECLKELVI